MKLFGDILHQVRQKKIFPENMMLFSDIQKAVLFYLTRMMSGFHTVKNLLKEENTLKENQVFMQKNHQAEMKMI